MNVRVGPFYGGSENDFQRVQDAYYQLRKPSADQLESVRLKPTLTSFPPPHRGHSPTLPDFSFPDYDYSSVVQSPFREHVSIPVNLSTEESGHNSVIASVFSSTNFFLGVGILGLPFGMMCSGWAGVAILILIGTAFSYSAHLLGRCQYRLNLRSYPDISEAAFGVRGRVIISGIFYFELMFNMALLLIALASSVDMLSDLGWDTSAYVMALVLIIETNLFTTMMSLPKLSMIGAMSTACLNVVILLWISINLSRKCHSHHNLPPTQSISNAFGLGKSLGIFSFVFTGHAILPTVFKSMQKPSSFPAVINMTFGMMLFWYLILSMVAYATYGDAIRGNIVSNLQPQTALGALINVLICVSAATKFPLAVFPVTECCCDMVELTHQWWRGSPQPPLAAMNVRGDANGEGRIRKRTPRHTPSNKSNSPSSSSASLSPRAAPLSVVHFKEEPEEGPHWRSEDEDEERRSLLRPCVDVARTDSLDSASFASTATALTTPSSDPSHSLITLALPPAPPHPHPQPHQWTSKSFKKPNLFIDTSLDSCDTFSSELTDEPSLGSSVLFQSRSFDADPDDVSTLNPIVVSAASSVTASSQEASSTDIVQDRLAGYLTLENEKSERAPSRGKYVSGTPRPRKSSDEWSTVSRSPNPGGRPNSTRAQFFFGGANVTVGVTSPGFDEAAMWTRPGGECADGAVARGHALTHRSNPSVRGVAGLSVPLAPAVAPVDGTQKERDANKSCLRVCCAVLVRTLLPLVALGLAVALPDFAQLLSLVGGVFGILISFVIPLLLYQQIFADDMNVFEQCGLLFGVVVGIAGCVVTICVASFDNNAQ